MNKEFRPFQPILVKQQVWRAAYFSHKRSDEFIVTTGGGRYRQDMCLPYEGNEDLLGTDKSPKPKRWRAEYGSEYWCVTTDLTSIAYIERDDGFDDNLYDVGNYFKTKEEAEVMAEKIKKLLNDE